MCARLLKRVRDMASCSYFGAACIYRWSSQKPDLVENAHNRADASDDSDPDTGEAHLTFGPDPEFVWDSSVD